jgi:hypothetical protein
MAHEHGPHVCYCPNCGHSITAEANVRCNTWTCPICGSQMRALEIGENRETRLSRNTAVASKISTDSIPCPVCGYPVASPARVGEQVRCAYCGTISQAIRDITIPSTVVVGFISFALGAIAGPALWQAVKGGAIALERVARERIR